MRINLKLLNLFLCSFILATFVFLVPVFASEPEGEFLGTLGPGESISTRNIAYGIIEVSPTNIQEYGAWCTNCSSYHALTTMEAKAVSSKYSVTVDGYPVFEYSSYNGGTSIIDFSAYSDKDAIISMPSDYTVTQKITCRGGYYEADGAPKESCGYSTSKKIIVTGIMQLYGYDKKPKVIANPQNVSCGTDASVSFSVEGEKTFGYRWQIGSQGVYVDLKEGENQNSVVYSGTNTATLNVKSTRCTLNGTSYRCILIGEKGDEVASEAAVITVNDTSAPKVKISYTPTDKTYEGVTILISANDIDSGLLEKPYYYKGDYHAEKSFKVTKNGNYDIKVTDNAGNIAESSISISNISPYPSVTPEPVPTVIPTTIPPTAIITPIAPKPTAIPTKKPSVKDTLKTEEDDKEKKEESVKKVNINNYKGTNKNKAEDKVIDKDYDLNIKKDDYEGPTATSPGPEEDIEVVEIKDNKTGSIIIIFVGILLFILAMIIAMTFIVRIDNSDELGSWHFCSIKFLSIGREYSLKVGLLLEDFDTLRLHFGPIFMLLCKGHSLLIILEDSKTIVIDEITQNLIVDYNQARRE